MIATRYLRPALPILLVLLLIGMAGCATKAPKAPTTDPDALAEALRTADRLHGQGEIDEALSRFLSFVQAHPDHPDTPTALLKIASIQDARGEIPAARDTLSRLIRDYPGSAITDEARLRNCATYMHEGRYQKALRCIRSERPRDAALRLRLGQMEAEALAGIGQNEESTRTLMAAMAGTRGQLRNRLAQSLTESLHRLPVETIATLLEEPGTAEAEALLLFMLGTRLSEEGRYVDARAALGRFVNHYPEHPEAAIARDLLHTLKDLPELASYTIGGLFPLSGKYAKFGNQALQGVQLALATYAEKENAAPVKVVVEDSASDPTQTLSAVKRLEARQVMGIVGPLVTVAEAATEAEAAGIPILVLSQKPGIAELGTNVFQSFITPKMQIETLVTQAMTEGGVRRFAILHPDDAYGTTLMEMFWDEVERQGGEIRAVESYRKDATDFADAIKKTVGLYYPVPEDLKEIRDAEAALSPEILAALDSLEIDTPLPDAIFEEPLDPAPIPSTEEPEDGVLDENAAIEGADSEEAEAENEPQPVVDFEAIFIPDGADTVGLVAPQLAFFDVEDVRLLGTNLWHSQELIHRARRYVQGAWISEGFFAMSHRPEVRDFVTRFTRTFGERPGLIEAMAYDSAMLLFERLEKGPFYTRRQLLEQLLAGTPHHGVTGALRFKENGEADKNLFLLEVQGRRFRELPRPATLRN